MNRRMFIFFVIAVELIVITYLGAHIWNTYSSTIISVIEVDGDIIYKPVESKYEYFYDTKSNTNSINGSDPVPTSLNKSGLRDRYDYATVTPQDVTRIIVLGDSHTYGVAVPVEHIYTEVLEDLLNTSQFCGKVNYEVINLGMHGYDLLYSEERYRLRGEVYEPDIILWYIMDGDFDDYKELEERMLDDLRQDDVVIGTEEITSIRDRIRAEIGQERLDEIQLEAISRLTDSTSANVVVFSGQSSLREGRKDALEVMATKKDNLEVIYPFKSVPEKYVFENDNHPNIEGHVFLAEKLYKYFNEEIELLRCE